MRVRKRRRWEQHTTWIQDVIVVRHPDEDPSREDVSVVLGLSDWATIEFQQADNLMLDRLAHHFAILGPPPSALHDPGTDAVDDADDSETDAGRVD